MNTESSKPILADASCVHCERRIGWHDGYFGCRGFTPSDPSELRRMYDAWFAENEPACGFRDENDVPSSVLVARAALARAAS